MKVILDPKTLIPIQLHFQKYMVIVNLLFN